MVGSSCQYVKRWSVWSCAVEYLQLGLKCKLVPVAQEESRLEEKVRRCEGQRGKESEARTCEAGTVRESRRV